MQQKWFQSQLPASIPAHQKETVLFVFPRTTIEVQDVVKLANITHSSLVHKHIKLDLKQLNNIRRHRTEEFLVTVETGITLGKLQEQLSRHKQRFPLTYHPDRTLENILADNPLSLSLTKQQPLPHWVVGIEAITGDGEYIHYGGEVVKNVTGYDMAKVFIGCKRQFGIPVSVTLKLLATPEATHDFLFHTQTWAEASLLAERLSQVLHTTENLAIFRTKTTFGWHILLSLAGHQELVVLDTHAILPLLSWLDPQLQDLNLALKSKEQLIQKLDWTAPGLPESLVVRVVLENNLLLAELYSLLSEADMNTADILMPLHCHQVLLRWSAHQLPPVEFLHNLKRFVEPMGGFIDILATPEASAIDKTMFQSTNLVLMQWKKRLQAQFDPNHVFALGQEALV